MTNGTATTEVRVRRLDPAAISGVMSREVANFRTYWKGDDLLERARADHLPARLRASGSARR